MGASSLPCTAPKVLWSEVTKCHKRGSVDTKWIRHVPGFVLACSVYQHSTVSRSTIYGNRHSGHDLLNTESPLHVSMARRQPAWRDELAWAFDCFSSSSNMRSTSCDKLNASMSCNGLLYRLLHLTLARICTLFFWRPLVREKLETSITQNIILEQCFADRYMFRKCTTFRQETSQSVCVNRIYRVDKTHCIT